VRHHVSAVGVVVGVGDVAAVHAVDRTSGTRVAVHRLRRIVPDARLGQ